MGKNKRLYYEVIPSEERDEAEISASDEKSPAVVEQAVTPERDEYAELIAAVKNTPRVRFRVMPNYSGGMSMITLFLAAIIIVGSVLLSLAKNNGMIIAVAVIMLVAVVGGIVAMIFHSSKSKRVYYCYYRNTENGVFCMSVIEDSAVVYADGKAYRINGEEFYTLDEAGFIDYLDGECSGLLSVLCAKREDVEFDEDTGFYKIKNRIGGGHTVAVEDGKVIEITSEQPIATDEVDAKTGERKIKTKTFVKVDPQYEFDWEVPQFVKDKLSSMGINVNSVIPRE